MPENGTILNLAPPAAYLSGNAKDKSVLFGGFPRLNPLLPQQIYALYFIIRKIYTIDQDYPGMTAACLYLWEIMGRYGIEAQGLNDEGGSVPSPTPSPDMPLPIEFYVSAISYIPTGGNTLLLDGSGGNPNWIGYNLLFNRNNQPQAMISDGGSSYFTWDRNAGIFTCIPAAQEGELFSLNPTL